MLRRSLLTAYYPGSQYVHLIGLDGFMVRRIAIACFQLSPRAARTAGKANLDHIDRSRGESN